MFLMQILIPNLEPEFCILKAKKHINRIALKREKVPFKCDGHTGLTKTLNQTHLGGLVSSDLSPDPNNYLNNCELQNMSNYISSHELHSDLSELVRQELIFTAGCSFFLVLACVLLTHDISLQLS